MSIRTNREQTIRKVDAFSGSIARQSLEILGLSPVESDGVEEVEGVLTLHPTGDVELFAGTAATWGAWGSAWSMAEPAKALRSTGPNLKDVKLGNNVTATVDVREMTDRGFSWIPEMRLNVPDDAGLGASRAIQHIFGEPALDMFFDDRVRDHKPHEFTARIGKPAWNLANLALLQCLEGSAWGTSPDLIALERIAALNNLKPVIADRRSDVSTFRDGLNTRENLESMVRNHWVSGAACLEAERTIRGDTSEQPLSVPLVTRWVDGLLRNPRNRIDVGHRFWLEELQPKLGELAMTEGGGA